MPSKTRRDASERVPAIDTRCEVCGAKPGAECVNIIDGKPLSQLLVNARAVHVGRVER